MKFRTWVVAIALVVLPYQWAVLAANSAYPSCPYGERIRMPMPFTGTGGYSFAVNIPELDKLADNRPEAPNQSPLVICENHRVLGPAHALHQDITARGQGRFSHWGTDMVFSTSDNSDPNTNGRSYLIIRTDRR
jgi:hypothetical protein